MTKDELTLREAEGFGDKLELFGFNVDKKPALDRAKEFAESTEGEIYTQVDTEAGLRYLKGIHVVNRTGVYAVLVGKGG